MTTENSRADAVAIVEKEADYWNRGHYYEGTRNVVRALPGIQSLPVGSKLYAAPPPVERPAAAPIDAIYADADRLISKLEHRPLAPIRGTVDPEVVDQMIRNLPTAPSPADERAAFEVAGATEALREYLDAEETWRIVTDVEDPDEIDPIERTMAASRRVAAREAARKILAARAASANETGAEGAFIDGQICRHCDCIRPLHDLDCPVAIEGMKPAPAQADARVGLTIERIESLARTHLYVGDDNVVFGTENFARAIERVLLDDDRA